MEHFCCAECECTMFSEVSTERNVDKSISNGGLVEGEPETMLWITMGCANCGTQHILTVCVAPGKYKCEDNK